MGNRPLLNLNHITLDPDLVKQVPYRLARYYLALPLAREDDQVSVIMAYPENTAAMAVLGGLLHARVVPVRGGADAIRGVLQRLQPAEPVPAPRILGWSAGPKRAAAVAALSQSLGRTLQAPVTVLGPGQMDLEMFLCGADMQRCSLAVVSLPDDCPPAAILRRTPAPLLLVRGEEMRPLRRILVVWRGFFSDELTVEWVLPLGQSTGSTITFVPLAGSGLPDLLDRDSAARQHIDRCLGRMRTAGLSANLRLRPGGPLQQIGEEAQQGDYDLVVMSAEGEGEFVSRALDELERRNAHSQRPVLVLKPAH
jgi:hypothetical protein